MAITLVVADEEQILRDGVKVLLAREGFTVVGEAGDGPTVVELARKLQVRAAPSVFGNGKPVQVPYGVTELARLLAAPL